MENKRLVIVDDHPIFREGLKQVITRRAGIDVVAEADNGDAALAQMRLHSPDLVMLDIAMPGRDGLEVLELTRELDKVPLTIVITSYDDNAYLNRAFELGARAFVIKDSAVTEIIDCLEAVMNGDIFVSPSLGRSKAVLPDLAADKLPGLDSLTDTERMVMAAVADFKTSKEIAKDLGISYRTVQNHRSNICNKLGLHGSHQLLSFACDHVEKLRPNKR